MANPLKPSLGISKVPGLPKLTPKLPDLATLPGGLTPGAEDALVGVRKFNRKRMSGGVLGGRSPVGTPGSLSSGTRTRVRVR